MINLNDYRKNIYSNEGILPSPGYGEDGVLEKIFEEIGVSDSAYCIEFGELRVLGSTTRSYRIKNISDATYFSASLDFKSRVQNILDILKVVINRRNLRYLTFFFSLPKKKTNIARPSC